MAIVWDPGLGRNNLLSNELGGSTGSFLQYVSAYTSRRHIWMPAGTTIAQLNAAGLALMGAGGGRIELEPSSYTIDQTLLFYPTVTYEMNWSTFNVANGLNANAMQGAAFAAGIGVSTGVQDYLAIVRHLILNGNRNNQTAGDGIGFGVYAYASMYEGLIIHDCRGPGIWSERNGGPTSIPAGNTAIQYMTNCTYKDIWLYNNANNDAGSLSGRAAPAPNNYNAAATNGQWHEFATDDIAYGVFVWSSGSVAPGMRGILVGQSAVFTPGCLQLVNSHIWLNHDYALDLNGNPSYIANDQLEGADTNVLLRSSGDVGSSNRNYLTFANGFAHKLDGGANDLVWLVQCSNIGNGGTFFNFINGGAFSHIVAPCIQPSGTVTLTTGTVPASLSGLILNGGGGGVITGASVRTLGTG